VNKNTVQGPDADQLMTFDMQPCINNKNNQALTFGIEKGRGFDMRVPIFDSLVRFFTAG
jgi:hypothetical protein